MGKNSFRIFIELVHLIVSFLCEYLSITDNGRQLKHTNYITWLKDFIYKIIIVSNRTYNILSPQRSVEYYKSPVFESYTDTEGISGTNHDYHMDIRSFFRSTLMRLIGET